MFHDEFLLDTDICIGFDKHNCSNEKVMKLNYDSKNNIYYEDLQINHELLKNNLLSTCKEFLIKYFTFMKKILL